MSVFLAAQEQIEVFFNGPMRSGLVFDSQALLDAGYADFQKKLAAHLRELYLGTWECPPLPTRRNQISSDIHAFQGETVIPRYVISRFFSDEDLDHILSEFHLQKEIRSLRNVAAEDEDEKKPKPLPVYFTTQRIEIYLYDFGYASCIIHGHVTALKDLSAEECRAAVEGIGNALPDYTEMFQGTLAKIAKVIPPQYLSLNTYAETAGPQNGWRGTILRQHAGEMFWMHRIFSFPASDAAEFARKKDGCRPCLYAERVSQMEDKSLRPDMAVYPGHGNSCIVYTKNETPDWNAARLRSVVRAMNVFYAALQDADRDHFHINNETSALSLSEDPSRVSRQLQHASQVLARTGFLKSVYDDYDNQLDPQSLAIWNHLRHVWQLADMFRALDQKTAMTEKIYDRISRLHAAKQSQVMGHKLVVLLIVLCLPGAFFSLKGAQFGMAVTMVLAFIIGAATLMAVRYFREK